MITQEEKEKLVKFREILPGNLLRKDLFEDDYFLIRWLRARQLDVDKAYEMLLKSLKWRKEIQADSILENEDIPEKFKKLFPTALLGRDDEDCVGVLLPLGRFDHRLLFEEVTMDTAVKFNMIWMEKMMQLVKQAEQETGKKGLRLVEIVDMEKYSYKELIYGPAREFIIRTNTNCDDNYPEMLKTLMVINAPKIFTLMFNFVRPFMSKATLSKVRVYGGGLQEEQWKEVIRARFKPELVPKRWGGSRGSDDDIFCCNDSEIWMDGPIPLSFFTNDALLPDELTERIKPRDQFQLNIPVKLDQEGCPKLQWKFKVENHDVGFGITFKSSISQEETVVLPIKRFDSKLGLQDGSHLHSRSKGEGIYTLVFDNKYSFTRSKAIHYSVQLVYIQDSDEEDGNDNNFISHQSQ